MVDVMLPVLVVVAVVVLRVVAARCLVGVTLPHVAAIAATVTVPEARLSREMRSHAELMTREIGVLPLLMERNVTFARTLPRSMMTWILRILRTRGSLLCLLVRLDVVFLPLNRSQKLESQQNFFSVFAAAEKRWHKFRKSLGNSHFLFFLVVIFFSLMSLFLSLWALATGNMPFFLLFIIGQFAFILSPLFLVVCLDQKGFWVLHLSGCSSNERAYGRSVCLGRSNERPSIVFPVENRISRAVVRNSSLLCRSRTVSLSLWALWTTLVRRLGYQSVGLQGNIKN